MLEGFASSAKAAEYAEVIAAYDVASTRLAEFAASLVGYTVLFRRGRMQLVLAEVIGAKGTVLTIRNVESDRSYWVDLKVTKIEKVAYTVPEEPTKPRFNNT